LILRVFLPFCLGYFLSYLYRVVNAVIYRDLVQELSLPAITLGLLTAAYFVLFALAQLPLGLVLDRFGPRRVNAALMAVAALGAFLFSVGTTATELTIARALIGLGCSAALMASIKAFIVWFPMDRQPVLTGWLLAIGGLGAMVGTAPVEWLVSAIGWRQVFVGLTGVTLLVGLILITVVPERRATEAPESFGELIKGLRHVLSDGYFWAIGFIAICAQGAAISLQTLWVAPWLRDVMGIPRGEASLYLLAMNFSLVAGFLIFGSLTDRLTKFGLGPERLLMIGVLGEALSLLVLASGWHGMAIGAWIVLHLSMGVSPVTYALLSRRFAKSFTGRAATSANMCVFVAAFAYQLAVGAVLDVRPEGSGYAEEGYAMAFFAIAVSQLAAVAWFWHRVGSSRAIASQRTA
jgi:MFS family permease